MRVNMSDAPKIFLPDEGFYQNHITFTSVDVIKEMLKELSELGITYFTFDRTYTDGAHLRLTSAGEWVEYYYRQKLYDMAIFEKTPAMFTNGVLFWSWLKREPVYSKAALHDIDHGLTIVQSHRLYCDFFHFGTYVNNPIPEATLLSQLDCLHKFIAVFKQKARDLIKKAEAARFILPTKLNTKFEIKDVVAANNLSALKQGEIKRFYLGDEFGDEYLTGKEMQIMLHLCNGNKLVDVAKMLFISEKTAETHIGNIKSKLKCRTMFELGVASQNLGLQNISFRARNYNPAG
jgi:DNA-binding CsgD family transcriptional regulator